MVPGFQSSVKALATFRASLVKIMESLRKQIKVWRIGAEGEKKW